MTTQTEDVSILLETEIEKAALATMVAVAVKLGGIFDLLDEEDGEEGQVLVFMPFNDEGLAAVGDLERAMEIIYPTPTDG